MANKRGSELEENFVINSVVVNHNNGNRWPGEPSRVGLLQDEFGTITFVGNRKQLEGMRGSICLRCRHGDVVSLGGRTRRLLPGDQTSELNCEPRNHSCTRRCSFVED